MVKIYVPDIECDSCVRRISKKLHENKFNGISFDSEGVIIENDHNKNDAIKIIRGLGYRAATTPFERKTWKERLNDFKENTQKYNVEVKGLQYTMSTFIILEILFLLAFFGLFRNMPNFMSSYGQWMLYLIISVSAIGFGLWHFYSYKAKITCMTGMMIGMTFGMQTGMMIGAVVGATNGFFVGSMTGMLLGTFVGWLTGKSCGVMGIMEGMMAGLMGGTMGPMITSMMLYDRVSIFMPFYMTINLLIIFGLSYMFYEEVVEKSEGLERKPVDFTTFVSIAIIITFLIGALIVYGPKAAALAI
jgi:cation transport ATPase